jgi:hypothetical protein
MAAAEAEVIQVPAPSGAFSAQQILGQLAEEVNMFGHPHVLDMMLSKNSWIALKKTRLLF